MIGSVCQGLSYAAQSPVAPFVVKVLASGLCGLGISLQVRHNRFQVTLSSSCNQSDLQNAQANSFVASLKDNATTKLGFLHAAYGKETNTWLHTSNLTKTLHLKVSEPSSRHSLLRTSPQYDTGRFTTSSPWGWPCPIRRYSSRFSVLKQRMVRDSALLEGFNSLCH